MTGQPALREALSKESERLIEDSLHTGRNNQEAGRWWSGFNTWVGAPSEVAAAILAGGAGVSALVGNEPNKTAALALISAALTALRAFFKPAEQADAYTLKGTRFIAIRNEARFFREIDLASSASDEELTAQLRDLRQRYANLNETAPLVVQRMHYLRARESIEAGESDYKIDRQAKEGR